MVWAQIRVATSSAEVSAALPEADTVPSGGKIVVGIVTSGIGEGGAGGLVDHAVGFQDHDFLGALRPNPPAATLFELAVAFCKVVLVLNWL